MSFSVNTRVEFKDPLFVCGKHSGGVILCVGETGVMISVPVSTLSASSSTFKVGDTIVTTSGRVGRITSVQNTTSVEHTVRWFNGDEGKIDEADCIPASQAEKEAFESQVLRVLDEIDADIASHGHSVLHHSQRVKELQEEKEKLLEKANKLGIKKAE